jgi:hypothetical protein
MKRTLLLFALLASGALPGAAAGPPPSAEQVRFFETRVRPLLLVQCASCHGPKKQNGGLRLDSAAGLRAGGDSGAVVVPGKPEQSLLLRAVRYQGPKMPPTKALAAADVATLVEWVKMGAPWPAQTGAVRNKGTVTDADRAFWAFRPVRDRAVPVVKNTAWPRTAIDRFLLAKLEEKGLAPAASADRRTLIRRATFDLLGLPPAPEEVEAFVHDASPGAWEKVIDRLLASPAYGERYGRHWLDVVRYADTAGDNSDYPVPQLWKYRNWVLRAFNADTPYDEFLREQVAGDLLPAAGEQERYQKIIATGYLAGARRFGSYEDRRYQWYLTFEDTIENLGRTVLGLSLSCARCHDHKFDPIPSADYYALYGFFQSTRYPWPGIELDKVPRDLVPLAPAEQVEAVLRQRKKELDELDEMIKEPICSEEGLKQGRARRAALRAKRDRLARTPLPLEMAYAVAEGKRWVGNARVQKQGDPTRPGNEVPRRFLQVLGGETLPAGAKGSGRLELARWLTDPKNPLTARVMVNRLWLYHFGRGLVSTPNDFGRQGQPPSHPALLDYLAARFVESGWSVKAMHRLILRSRAYQMASENHEGQRKVGPDNNLLYCFNPRRLDAEALRDTLLSLSGLLTRTPGGPHPFPDQRTWNFTQHNPFKAVYDTDRRSVYLMTQRIQRHPYLALFDGADTNASTAKRGTSTTPLQALYLMNDPWVHRLARGFAARLQRERTDEAGRIDWSFRLAFGRPPAAQERTAASAFLARVRGQRGEARAWESYARALFLTSELIYID